MHYAAEAKRRPRRVAALSSKPADNETRQKRSGRKLSGVATPPSYLSRIGEVRERRICAAACLKRR